MAEMTSKEARERLRLGGAVCSLVNDGRGWRRFTHYATADVEALLDALDREDAERRAQEAADAASFAAGLVGGGGGQINVPGCVEWRRHAERLVSLAALQPYSLGECLPDDEPWEAGS